MSAVLSHTGYSDEVWDAVRAMWMAGNSASSIGQKDGMPSKQAICVRAKEEGWQRVDEIDEELALIPFDGLTEQQCFAVRKLADGLPKKHVAALCGVDPTTISRWLGDNAEFAKAAQAAVAAKTYRRLKKVERAEDWKAQTWLLERDKDSRDDFAPKYAPAAAFNFNVLGQVQVDLPRQEACATLPNGDTDLVPALPSSGL